MRTTPYTIISLIQANITQLMVQNRSKTSKKRATEFLNEKIIPLEKKCQNVLIVGHGCLNHCIINPILGIGNDNFWQIDLPNCAVSILSLRNGKFNVIEPCKIFYWFYYFCLTNLIQIKLVKLLWFFGGNEWKKEDIKNFIDNHDRNNDGKLNFEKVC